MQRVYLLVYLFWYSCSSSFNSCVLASNFEVLPGIDFAVMGFMHESTARQQRHSTRRLPTGSAWLGGATVAAFVIVKLCGQWQPEPGAAAPLPTEGKLQVDAAEVLSVQDLGTQLAQSEKPGAAATYGNQALWQSAQSAAIQDAAAKFAAKPTTSGCQGSRGRAFRGVTRTPGGVFLAPVIRFQWSI
jgi:hypothetical protein